MDTSQGKTDDAIDKRSSTLPGINIVSTMVTDGFLALAKGFNVSPEMLLSLAARQFVDDQPKALNVVSAAPLDTQECKRCPILKQCGSALRRARDKIVCFEKLPVAVALVAAALCLLLVPKHNADVTTAPVIEPPSLVEPSVLPDTGDSYLKPKARKRFSKKRERRKHVVRGDNPVLVAWNTVVRAGYQNARR